MGGRTSHERTKGKGQAGPGWWIRGTAWRPGWSRSEREGDVREARESEQDYTWLFERLLPLERDGSHWEVSK